MKAFYESPKAEIIAVCDVIATSDAYIMEEVDLIYYETPTE